MTGFAYQLLACVIKLFLYTAIEQLKKGCPSQTLNSKDQHRPDAIRQRDANFQFSKTNKTGRQRIKILQDMQTK
jgi:hypothetical protein